MRAFIALPLSREIQNALSGIQDELRSCHLNARFIPSSNLHITLKFLGDIDDDQNRAITGILSRAASAFSRMTVNLSGWGFFPSPHNPRVFFVSTDQESILTSLADFLENELARIGFKKEHRFRSHITIIRLRNPKNTDCVERKMKIHPPHGSFPIDKIVLFKSTLSPRGADYTPVFEANLRI